VGIKLDLASRTLDKLKVNIFKDYIYNFSDTPVIDDEYNVYYNKKPLVKPPPDLFQYWNS
jgi:hypothetical protein